MTEQQSLVQHCCAGEKKRWVTPLLHRFQEAEFLNS